MASLDDVRTTLETARHGYLSTASAEGDPHLQPVVFQIVGDSIYIAIDEKPKTTLRLRRLTNIESNPRFALLVDHYDDDWDRLWWILLRGPADVLWPSEGRADEANEVIAALRAKYSQYTSMGLEERPLLKLTPDRVTRWAASGSFKVGE